MRKIVAVILCVSLLLMFPLVAGAEESAGGKAEILIEADTGQVLFSKNADEKLPMASVTKTMSLLLFAENIQDGALSLEDKVKASSYASSADGSVIWLNAGEEMTAAELLEAVIVASANDACIALAEHVAGSEAAFVKLMNKKAKALKMSNTHYANCTGYDADGHYTTAYDTAIVTAQLMQYDVYRGYMLTWLDYLRGGETQLVNTNKLIRSYNGILGGKTGTTDNAGCCLTVCAERGDMRLIAVALGCEDDDARFSRAKELLDYGFTSFEKFTPETDRSQMKAIKVIHGTQSTADPILADSGDCIIKLGRAAGVTYEYTFVEEVKAPVEKGQFLGEYRVLLDGAEVFRSDIVAAKNIGEMSFLYSLWLVLSEIVMM